MPTNPMIPAAARETWVGAAKPTFTLDEMDCVFSLLGTVCQSNIRSPSPKCKGLSLTLFPLKEVEEVSAVGVTASFVPFTTVAGRSVTMLEPLESVVETRMEELTDWIEPFSALMETLASCFAELTEIRLMPPRIELTAASTRAIFV